MVREISAGGVVIRQREGAWWVAVIELPEKELPDKELPEKELPEKGLPEQPESVADSGKRSVKPRKARRPRLALPKGLVDAGEKPQEAAVREVYEETGITAEPITKLGDTKYVYVRTWSGGERVFKVVSFYLMKYRSGRIDDIAPEMRIEVARARWIALEEAPKLLAYSTEKQMVKRAIDYVKENALA
jgi:8-oxo-dGTP pyrophosphatase MutT (NUDIX family)